MGRTFEALEQSMRFTLTPEEHQVLGLTEEDVASFSDPGIALTPVEIDNAIVEIIASAYNESPVFKKLVDDDAARDPSRLGRSSKVVSKFLKHLRGVLPPETRAAIKTDTFDQAHEMVRGVLYNKLNKPAAPPVAEEKIEPITDQELALFNIPRASLTEKTRWGDIKNNILFFLGKLKDTEGKTIKNESTNKMPGDLKIQVLSKLLNDIRQKKLEASGGKLSPSDENFVGKDLRQLKIMARSMVVPTPGKQDPVYQNDLMEVNSQIGESLKMMDRIQELSKDTKFTAAIEDLTQALDTALPPVSLFEDRLNSIQEEISKLGLTKSQVSVLTDVDFGTLSYGDPVKKLLEDQRVALQGVQKEIQEQGSTPDQDLKLKNIQGQIKQLEDLSVRDTSGLKGAVEDYLSTLRTYKDHINKNITNKKLDDKHQKTLTEFTRMVDQMALTFSRLTREELFKAKWAVRSGMLIRGEKPAAPMTSEVPVEKMAADPGATGAPNVSQTMVEKPAGYAAKLHAFKGKGLGDAYREIQDIIEDGSKLPAIKGKLIDLLGFKDKIEAVGKVFDSGKDLTQIKEDIDRLTEGTIYGPQITEILEGSDDLGKLKQVITNILSQDKTVMTQTEGVSHEDISLADAVKMVGRLRSLIKKLKIEDKGAEALDVISWAADLKNHIKSGKAKKFAFVGGMLRKFARTLFGADDKLVGMRGVYQEPGDTHKGYQSPAGVGSEKPLGSAGKARPILFRERLTKMGKKALQSVFDEPTFVPDFVEEMEKAGLNRMMVHGGELKEMDIEPVLDEVLKKVTGKTGDLENILMTKTMQAFNTEFSINKTKKELEESRARVKDINTKISEIEDKYLPKLQEFASFIQDPIGATREQLENLKWSRVKSKKDTEKDFRGSFEDIKPEKIDSGSYRSVLRRLSDKYLPKMSKQAKDTEKVTKKPSDMTRMLPNEFIKQYMVWKKQLKDSNAIVDREQDPYKKAVALEKYYSFMIVVTNRVSDYLEYQDKVLRSDETMITDIDSFLKSDDAKSEKPEFIQESEALLGKLKGSFDTQKKVYESLKNAHSNIRSVINVTEDQLKTIRDDIEDKKVDMVYQVAVSPDLVPDKDTARSIKEWYKEHEKGLSYIIDRATYKNNMNRLMMYKKKFGPIKSYPGQGVVVLPPERKKDLDNTLRTFEERVQKMNHMAESGMREVALRKLEEDLTKAIEINETGTEMIASYKALLENLDYLKKNKDTMDPAEYNKQMATLKSTMVGKGIDEKGIKKDIERELEYLDTVSKRIPELKTTIEKARKTFEEGKPSEDIPKKVDLMLQKLYRLRGVGQDSALKPETPQRKISLIEDKIKQIEELDKIPVNAAPGTPGEQAYKKFKAELDHILEISKEELNNLKGSMGAPGAAQPVAPMAKTAAQGDPTGDEGKSTYEKALDKKGIKPAPYMQELPKPKGWDIVENFFTEIKREHNFLNKYKEEGKLSTLQSGYLKKRIDQLENMVEAIDAYKNQKVTIGGDPVVFRDVMEEFEKTLSDYQDLLAKYTNQRDDAVNKVAYLQQELDHYNEMYDPETGEFKGLDPEEIANLKGIFLRMLYKDLERYWATRVGKDLSVFGERDTNWYNNVFMTFKKVAQARSNKKMLGLLNKYKQETRSDFDDMTNRFKSQQLEKDRDQLLEGYQEYGVDPEISSRLKDLNTRIETLKKQEKQMDRIFNFMGTASLVSMQADFEKMLRDKVQELAATTKSDEAMKTSKANLEEKADKSIDEAIKAVVDDLPAIVEHARESELADKDLAALKAMREEREPVPETAPTPSVSKMAFDKNHQDFNLNILYGSYMQSKIAEMLSEEIK